MSVTSIDTATVRSDVAAHHGWMSEAHRLSLGANRSRKRPAVAGHHGSGRLIRWSKTLTLALIACCALGSAVANAQTLHARSGETIALGVADASVYYDAEGQTFRFVATFAGSRGSMPARLTTTLQLGQSLTISVPGSIGELSTAVRVTRTPEGVDVTYPRPTS